MSLSERRAHAVTSMRQRRATIGGALVVASLITFVLWPRAALEAADGSPRHDRFDLRLRLAPGARAAVDLSETTQATLRYDGRRRQISTQTRALGFELDRVPGSAGQASDELRLSLETFVFVDDDPLRPARGEGRLDHVARASGSEAAAPPVTTTAGSTGEARVAALAALLGASASVAIAREDSGDFELAANHGSPELGRWLARLAGGRPAHPVAVGDTWEEPCLVEIPSIGVVQVTRTHTLHRLESRGPRRLGRVETKIRGELSGTSDEDIVAPFELRKLAGSESRLIDLVNGLALESTLTLTIDLHGERGRLRTLYTAESSAHVLR